MSKVILFSVSALLLALAAGLVDRELYADRPATAKAICECGDCESGCHCCLGETCICGSCGCGDCECVAKQSAVPAPEQCNVSSQTSCCTSCVEEDCACDLCECDLCEACLAPVGQRAK